MYQREIKQSYKIERKKQLFIQFINKWISAKGQGFYRIKIAANMIWEQEVKL